MSLSTQPYKGARDFYPEDFRQQRWMFGICTEVLERYGYERYDAPMLEPLELYQAKSGEEIVNEQTYLFEDRGGRKVVIRPEMTPTVSRMVAAKRQELSYPLRWYSIPNLWRYERPQKGRLREHWQLNADVFGVDGFTAEQEMIQIVDSIMRRFGAEHSMYKIRLNDRRFVDYVLSEHLGLDEVQSHSVAKLIDKMHKMDHADFLTHIDGLCTPSQREEGVVERLQEILEAPTIDQLPPILAEHPSLDDLKSLIAALKELGVTNAVFDCTLMRGFDYYSGIVFEVFDTSPENSRSMFGGGRYDGLVALFGVEPVPTVGFGMGDVVLADFLTVHGLIPHLPPETHVYLAVAGEALDAAQTVAAQLRKNGVNVALDLSGKSLDKQMKTANKKGVPFVMVIGQQEVDSGQFKLKNMHDGTEETHGLDRIASIVEDYRHRGQEE